MRFTALSILIALTFGIGSGGQGFAQSESEEQSDASQTETSGNGNVDDANAEEPAPPRKLEKNTEGIYDLTFDDIKFEMEVGGDFDRSLLTDNIRLLDGQEITLRGFIRPGVKASGLTKFIFVRDNQECCFGPGAALYDCVLVSLDKGHTTDFTVRAVTVTGTFYVKEYKVRDNILAIYRMRNARVR